jgi:hypothetical protein
MDWLSNTLEYEPHTLVLGNPPFGRQAKLAIEFINKASEIADTIAFVLPNTMTRYSAQSKVDSTLRLNKSILLPSNSFTLNGKPYDVPCVFQVWSRTGSCLRESKPMVSHPHFKISSRFNPNAKFLIRGARPMITHEIDIYDRVGSDTQYYSVEPFVDGVEEVFRGIDLVSKCRSIESPYLSIPECIKVYSEVVDDWFFDNESPTHIVMRNTRVVKPISELKSTNNCVKIHANVDNIADRFNDVTFTGIPMLRGGGFSITNNELAKQYYDHYNSNGITSSTGSNI